MKAYKVVSVRRNNWRSSWVQGKMRLDSDIFYKINKWTTPKKDCGPLCVFSTLTAAETFFKRYPFLGKGVRRNEIWECDIVPSGKVVIWAPSLGTAYAGEFPSGTVLASKIKLLKKIA